MTARLFKISIKVFRNQNEPLIATLMAKSQVPFRKIAQFRPLDQFQVVLWQYYMQQATTEIGV